jgi:hypothetical protein
LRYVISPVKTFYYKLVFLTAPHLPALDKKGQAAEKHSDGIEELEVPFDLHC